MARLLLGILPCARAAQSLAHRGFGGDSEGIRRGFGGDSAARSLVHRGFGGDSEGIRRRDH
eukprot:1187698-Prorocentrum_minimum.AAC.1